jgi:CheY-like chemotaxis protein
MQSRSDPVSIEPHPATVLLAEEDEEIRDELASELRNDGYEVVAVEGGLELCDYLELARFSNGSVPLPDVIVSDTELSGFGGLEICEMLAGAGAKVPFILLAGNDDPDSWEDAERAGASHVLDKPVDLLELRDAVACFVEQQ